MNTGRHLKVESMGSNAHGVKLRGDKRNPEHAIFIVAFLGGDVEISRTTCGDYWVHIRVNHPNHIQNPDGPTARITDARLDIHGRHTSEVDTGEFADADLYHVAVRVKRDVVQL